MKKILFTGGHLTPALAMIEYLQEVSPATEIIFVGRHDTGQAQQSQEEREVVQLGAQFVSLNAVKFQNASWLQKILAVPGFLSSIFQAIAILSRTQPSVVVSFGGYLAVPIAIAAWLVRVPIVTHEQTARMGLANQVIAHLSRQIAIAHDTSSLHLQRHAPEKVTVTGNPLRPSLWAPTSAPKWVPSGSKPLLYVTGGNQGSQVINQTLATVLPHLLKHWRIIHQCGAPSRYHNYLAEFSQLQHQLPAATQSHYVVREWITATELSWIYQHASAVISRGGANTLAELAAFHLPAIVVPLPFAYQDEQLLNAQTLQTAGAPFTIIAQKELSAEQLVLGLSQLKPRPATPTTEMSPLARESLTKLYALISATARP